MEMDTTFSEPIEPRAPPCWWKQGYTRALVAVAGVHLALAPALAKWTDWAHDGELTIGMILGQGYLLGLWAALGGLRVIVRWAIVGTLCVVGIVSIVVVVHRDQQDFVEILLSAGLLAMLFVTGVAMLLLPLRGLAGWRVDFDPRYYAHLPLRRGQVGLLDYAGYTCAVAGPLVVVRLMLELSREDAAGMGSVIAVLALFGATATIPSYNALVWRRFWLGVLASAGWVGVVSLVHSYLALYFASLGPGGRWGPIDLRIATFHAGVGIAVVATLGYLRRWGLRLLVVPEPPQELSTKAAPTPSRPEGYCDDAANNGTVASMSPPTARRALNSSLVIEHVLPAHDVRIDST